MSAGLDCIRDCISLPVFTQLWNLFFKMSFYTVFSKWSEPLPIFLVLLFFVFFCFHRARCFDNRRIHGDRYFLQKRPPQLLLLLWWYGSAITTLSSGFNVLFSFSLKRLFWELLRIQCQTLSNSILLRKGCILYSLMQDMRLNFHSPRCTVFMWTK